MVRALADGDVASSLEGYLHAIEKGAAEFPAAPGSLTIDPQASRLKDVCFNILALASSGVVPDDVRVEKTFHPLTYCKDDLTNVALAWHLFVAMRAIGALGKGTKVAALADEMHVAFASQLLAAGARGGAAAWATRGARRRGGRGGGRFHGGVGRVRRHARRGRREAGTAGSVHAARAVRGLVRRRGQDVVPAGRPRCADAVAGGGETGVVRLQLVGDGLKYDDDEPIDIFARARVIRYLY